MQDHSETGYLELENIDDSNQNNIPGLIHHWFVRYNPLYFFSALCVLAGVYLISKGIEEEQIEYGPFALAGVVQVYEWLLISGAIILYRFAGAKRPAVILGLLEVLFLFDWTWETDALALVGKGGAVTALIWVGLTWAKCWVLVWTFRLQPYFGVAVVSGLLASWISVFPVLMKAWPDARETVALIAVWLGVGLTAWVLYFRAWNPRGGNKNPISVRCLQATLSMGAGLYMLHWGAWFVEFGIPFKASYLAPIMLLLPFLSVREFWSWMGAGFALALSSVDPATVSATAFVAAGLMAWQALRTGHFRLFEATLLLLFVSAWTFHWSAWPLPPHWTPLNLTGAAALLALAYGYRLPSAILPAVLLLVPVSRDMEPGSTLEWGILVMTAGFAALMIGVYVNWIYRNQKE